jgi:hypothetical protein
MTRTALFPPVAGRGGGKTYLMLEAANARAKTGARVMVIVATARDVPWMLEHTCVTHLGERHFHPLDSLDLLRGLNDNFGASIYVDHRAMEQPLTLRHAFVLRELLNQHTFVAETWLAGRQLPTRAIAGDGSDVA